MPACGSFLLMACLTIPPVLIESQYGSLFRVCGPGTELLKTYGNIECTRCARGHYSRNYSPVCKPCRTCRHGVKRPCTETSNTHCLVRRYTIKVCVKLFKHGKIKKLRKHCRKFYRQVKGCGLKGRCGLMEPESNTKNEPSINISTGSVRMSTNSITQEKKEKTSTIIYPPITTMVVNSSAGGRAGTAAARVLSTLESGTGGYSVKKIEEETNFEEEIEDTSRKGMGRPVIFSIVGIFIFLILSVSARALYKRKKKLRVPRSDNVGDAKIKLSTDTLHLKNGDPEEVEQQLCHRERTDEEGNHKQVENISCHNETYAYGQCHAELWKQISNTLPVTKEEKAAILKELKVSRPETVPIYSSLSSSFQAFTRSIRQASLCGSSMMFPKTLHDLALLEGAQTDLESDGQSDTTSCLEDSPGSSVYSISRDVNEAETVFENLNLLSEGSIGEDARDVMEPVYLSRDVSWNALLSNHDQNRGQVKDIGYIDNLYTQKKRETNPHNIFENLHKSKATQTRNNHENTRSIFSKKWDVSGHFSSEGGVVVMQGSDIRLDIPCGAVKEGNSVLVQGHFTVDVTHLHPYLEDNEAVVSPVAEFQMTYADEWQKLVKITIPCVHTNPKNVFSVKFYHQTGGEPLEHGNVPLFNPRLNQDMYYIKMQSRVEIYTNHFTGFYCSECQNFIPLELFAMVFGCYGDSDMEAWVSLYIGDKRLEIRDFKQKIIVEEKNLYGRELRATEEIRLLEESDRLSRLEVRLEPRTEPQSWQCVEYPVKQVRRLSQLVKCLPPVSGQAANMDNEPAHQCYLRLKWIHKPIESSPAAFSFKIIVEHVLSEKNITDRHGDAEEGITLIVVPPIQLSRNSMFMQPKPAPVDQVNMAFPELPSSRKPRSRSDRSLV